MYLHITQKMHTPSYVDDCNMQQQLTDTLQKADMRKSVLVFVKVEELQKRLMAMEEEASAARSAATESLRLTDENTLLGNQLKQMEFNLKAKFPLTQILS